MSFSTEEQEQLMDLIRRAQASGVSSEMLHGAIEAAAPV